MNQFMSWVSSASSVVEDWLMLAVAAGVFAALVAIPVLAINLLLRRWLSAAQMGALWGLVLLRLLLPAAPSSSWSLQNLLVGDRVEGIQAAVPAIQRDAAPVMRRVSGHGSQAETFGATVIGAAATEQATMPELSRAINTLFESLPLVWFLGATSCLAWTLATHWRFARRVNRTPPSDDCRLLGFWAEACRAAGVGRMPRLIEFSDVQQAAVTGLFRPTLLLPPEVAELDDERLRMIMLHELAHIRRRDVAANWALAAIRAVHWWNPVYWLAAAWFSSLREQACDAFVIERTDANRRRVYGELLVTMAEREPATWRWRVTLPAGMLGFLPSFFRKLRVRGRLVALHSLPVRRSRWQAVAGLALLLLMATSGLTDARSPAISDAGQNLRPTDVRQPTTVAEWMAQPRTDGVDAGRKSVATQLPPDLGPLIARTYDVTKVLQRLAVDEPDIAPSKALEFLLAPQLAPATPDQMDLPLLESVNRVLKRVTRRFRIEGNTLHVFAPESCHDELGLTLQAWGESGIGQISIRTRVIRSQRDLAAAVGLSWQYFEARSSQPKGDPIAASEADNPIVRVATIVDEFQPIVVMKLDGDQKTAFIDAAQGDRRSNVLQTPSVTLFNGQTAMMKDSVQRPFVIGVSYIEGAEGYSGAHQPKIEVVEEGSQFQCRATHSADLTKIKLEARLRISGVEKVFTTSTVHRGSTVTIQTPRVKRFDVDVAAEVADGESLLVGCLPTGGQDEYVYVLFTPESLTGRAFRAGE